MHANAETFEPFVADLPWDHYLFELQKVETWGSYLELMALSKMLKVNFTIYTETAAPTVVDHGFAKQVNLAFSGGNHYDLVMTNKENSTHNYCQELVYELVNKALDIEQSKEHKEYKNVAYECWLEDLKKQENRDQLITKKLLESPQVVDYATLSGYYKKDTSPQQPAKESTKNKKQRNKKTNKPSTNIISNSPTTPLSTDDIELQSILQQIEEVEKKQLHHISFNKDFPELKSKSKANATNILVTNNTTSPILNPTSMSSTIITPVLNPIDTVSTGSSETDYLESNSATPAKSTVNAWKSPKSWNTESK